MTTILQKLTDIENRLSALSVNVAATNNINCGCPGGSVPQSEGVVEGSDPPVGFVATDEEFPSAEYDNRKCAIANLLHSEIVQSVEIWEINEVDVSVQRLGAISFGLITALVGAFLGNTAVPILGGIAGGTIGLIAGIGAALLAPSVNLSTIGTALAANDEDLVCALYSSSSAIGARYAYLLVLDGAGLSLANQAVVAAILVTNFLNVLYFNPAGKEAELADLLDGYSPPVDCAACAPSGCERIYFWGQEEATGEGTLDAQALIANAQRPGCGFTGEYRISMSFDAEFASQCVQPSNCGGKQTMLSVSVISGAIQQSGGTLKLRFFSVTGTQLFGTNTLPWTGSVANVARIICVGLGTSPYTIRATFS